MSDLLLLFYENHVNVRELSADRPFQIGGPEKKADWPVPAGVTGKPSLTLRKEDGGWKADCRGEVFSGGQPVKETVLRHGDFLAAGDPPVLGIQLLSISDRPAAELSLDPGTELLIGRGENCGLRLKNRRVSSSHAKLYQIGSEWHIGDISSTNGTYLNDEKIRDAAFRPGDRVLIGPYFLELSDGKLRVFGEPETILLQVQEEEAPDRKEYPAFSISPRLTKQVPQGKITIEAAPSIGAAPSISIFQVIQPMLGVFLGAIVMAALSAVKPYMLLVSLPMTLIGVIGTVVNYRKQKAAHQDLEALRTRKYEDYIKEQEEKIKAAVRTQQDALLSAHPDPGTCLRMAEHLDARLWQRTVQDEDFMSLRIGTGQEPLSVEIDVPKVGFTLTEDTYTRAPEQLKQQYETVSGLPVTADLMRVPSLGIVGERSAITRTARAMVLQAAAHHSYQDLHLVFLYDPSRKKEWEMMRWLPHTHGAGQVRFLASNGYEASRFLQDIADEAKARLSAGDGSWQREMRPQLPYYLFIVDQPALLADQPVLPWLLRGDISLGMGCIYLSEQLSSLPGQILQILEIRGGSGELYRKEDASSRRSLVPDQADAETGERMARSLAPIRLPEKDSSEMLPASITWLDGWHVRTPEELDLEDFWANARPEQSMSVPIGIRANGEAFYFDIHEKKHGPHGLVAGMTGSGKSEMVQSWILSMATQFSPQDVSFVLIDFKGTGLILPFMNLPHLAGTISDLDSNITRNLIALESELQRRKALFDAAGVNNITGYLKLYRAGKVTEPLSYLFVIIDEYAEFKSKFPDFTSEVNSLFRTGRSMGVHIMLLTQNPSGIVSGESETNVRFRWCLKVASASASKEVLGGHDEAARITNPGRAYVRVGTDEVFEPVQSFYSGAAYDPSAREEKEEIPQIAAVTLTGERVTLRENGTKEKKTSRGSQIDAVVAYIRSFTEKQGIPDARHIWQGRMADTIFLEDLLEAEAAAGTEGQGGVPGSDELAPVIGLIDDPARQIQRPLRLPLSADGHAVIIGAPGSGKTVLLQTLITSVALTRSPQDVRIYIMDFGGWSLGMFKDFPQVAGIANDNEEEKLFSIASRLDRELQSRKERFSAEGVGTLAAYRSLTGEKLPYILLVVDNFTPVFQLYPKLEDFFIRLGREGGSYGILLAATAGTVSGVGYKLNQSIRTHLALQMADPSDYAQIVGRTGGLVPEAAPGRGLVNDGGILEFQTALPVRTADAGYAKAMRELAAQLRERYAEETAEEPEELLAMPEHIGYGSISPAGLPEGSLLLGLRYDTLKAAGTDPLTDRSLLISGTDPARNTELMRVLLRQAAEREDSHIAVFGAPEAYAFLGEQADVLTDGETAGAFVEALGDALSQRAEVRRLEPDAVFEAVIFAIDGYRAFVDQASQQTMRRLQALITRGTDLQLFVLAADTPVKIDALKQFMEPGITALAEGPAVLAGGSAMQHLAVSTSLDPIEKNMQLAADDAWLHTKEGTIRIRLMREDA